MVRGSANSKNTIRRIVAAMCLLALVALYAPIAGALCIDASRACCKGGQCPLHGNHHQDSHDPKQQDGMDCGHGMGMAMSCSLSCCHTTQIAAVHGHIFVAAPPAIVGMPTAVALRFAAPEPQPFSFLHDPQSPPPEHASR